jgi:hypothetical protein
MQGHKAQSLRMSTLEAEGSYQVSKWLQVQVLLDHDEMQALLQELAPLYIYITASVLPAGHGYVPLEQFLSDYSSYVQSLQAGQVPNMDKCKTLFSGIMTCSPDMLYAVSLGEDKQLVKVAKPVIQLQALTIDYSSLDGKFRAMVRGQETILWGLQFSYPQIYQEPHTKQMIKIAEEEAFPNTALFKKLQRWVRHHSRPTPFLVEGELTNVPMRLGNRCFAWINNHPQLKKKGIKVMTETQNAD